MNLSPSIQQHVRNVYTNLAVMLAISSLGAYLNMSGIIQGGTWSLVGCMGTLIAFSLTPPNPSNENWRKYLLYGFALSKGLSLGPLLSFSLYVNPRTVFTALLGTCLIFACFSLSVLTAPSRNVLYTRGLLSTAAMLLAGLGLVNIFVGSKAIFNVELYLGLMVFAGYVVYDTQLMITKAELGSRDYLRHSMELYVDLVAIFVRVLTILNKRAEEKDKRRRNEKRR
ncbi:hypothetical protein SpCBS45565_g00780 [Spizellomyces sp. 'palustris']|nr:hypothetical protein SpCBS45565_g00780 [Spizellomyces sp. 'palustris']